MSVNVLLQDDIFFKLGQLGATALAQGGSGHHIFSPSVFNFIRGMSVSEVIADINDIPDERVKRIAQEVIFKLVHVYTCNVWVSYI